jgi:isopenicillin N synthase-like dioxygenase
MAYARVKNISAATIPVIDVAPLATTQCAALEKVAAEMLAASETTGFFYVSNHGVPRGVIDEMVAQAFRFFRRPQDEKRGVLVSPQHRGFIPVGEAKMYPGARPDLKESYVWGLDIEADDPDVASGRSLLAPNRWPAGQPQLRAACNAYFDACHGIAWRMMRAFAVALEIEEDYFVRRIGKPVSRGTAVYYPSQPPESDQEQFGVAPHTDYGCLTLVYQANVGGLEVHSREREWVLAHRIEDTFVVNVGDLLARWTNDRFRSTPHRVVNRSGEERLSIAVFVDPDNDTLIEPVCRAGEPPRYPPVTCGEYIRGRYDKSFAYRRRQ